MVTEATTPRPSHTLGEFLYFLLQMKQGSNRVSVGLGRHGPIYKGLGESERVGAGRGEPWQSHNIPMSLAAQVLLPPQGPPALRTESQQSVTAPLEFLLPRRIR